MWFPKTEEEKDQVRRQMGRLLETSHFKNSRRYPALFRFIVEETLEGRGEFLKERLLGIRVFNRAPDYDTSNDPIVRVTIAEIRKRIAQYYHEEAHEAEMRIELLPGRYEPEFHPCRARATTQEAPTEAEGRLNESNGWAKEAAAIPTAEIGSSRQRLTVRPTHYQVSGAALIVLIVAAAAAIWQWVNRSAVDEFWRPLLAAHQTVAFCLPSDAAGSRAAQAAGVVPSAPPTSQSSTQPAIAVDSPTFLDHETEGENVVFSDVLAMQKISNWLAFRGTESHLLLNDLTSLDDLQQGPTILIGGLDNNWTLRAISGLRYRFSGTGQQQYWIVDIKNPKNRDWQVDLEKRYSAVQRDYALIARFHDEATRQVQVVVAGIGMSGTAAAGKFLVDPILMRDLRRRVGRGFGDRDFEAVLSMDVVNGVGGSPTILAVEVR